MTSRLRTALLIGLGALLMTLVLTLVANPHALPLAACKVPAKRWPALSLEQKETYVVCNGRHAKQAIGWARAHRGLYRDRGRAVITAHRAIQRKAAANLRTIRGLLHPVPVLPSWYIALGACESGNDWHYNDGLYEGEINFLNSTWLDYGGGQFAAHAYDASRWDQYIVTLRMHADVPWSQSNPACSARLGL